MPERLAKLTGGTGRVSRRTNRGFILTPGFVTERLCVAAAFVLKLTTVAVGLDFKGNSVVVVIGTSQRQ